MNHRIPTATLAAATVLLLAGCAPPGRQPNAAPNQTARATQAAPSPANCLTSGAYQGRGEPSGGVQLTAFTISFDEPACQGAIATGAIEWSCGTTDGRNFVDGTTNAITGTDRFRATTGDVGVTLVTEASGTLNVDAYPPPTLTINTGRLNDAQGRGCDIRSATLFPAQTAPHRGTQIAARRRT